MVLQATARIAIAVPRGVDVLHSLALLINKVSCLFDLFSGRKDTFFLLVFFLGLWQHLCGRKVLRRRCR